MRTYQDPTMPMEVVFLTNFSDPCFRAIPSVAQLADDILVRLTILHAYDPDAKKAGAAEGTVRSFFPEADHYADTTRVAMEGDPLAALRKLMQSQKVDLVVCPGSDRLGLPRPGHRSLRGRILEELGTPVWTTGRGTDPARLGKKVNHVACWLDYEADQFAHVVFAAEYATKVGAALHLFYGLPEMDEGMILPVVPDRPMYPKGVREYFRSWLADLGIEPQVHVTTGSSNRIRAQMAREHDADVLFVDVPTSRLTKWVFSSVHAVDRTPCPSVCIASTSRPVLWTLDPSADREAEAAEAVAKLVPRKKELVARWGTAWA